MGLDQSIYRVSKPDLENKIYTMAEIRQIENLCSVSVADFNHDIHLLRQLMPYVTKRDVECEFYDVEKMITDYNLPKNSHIWSYGNNGITIGGYDENGSRVDQSISDYEVKNKYIKTDILPHYIWKQEEIHDR